MAGEQDGFAEEREEREEREDALSASGASGASRAEDLREFGDLYEYGFEDDLADDGFADAEELGQLVRPYTLTRGRTRHAAAEVFDLVTQISAAPHDPGTADEDAQDPEHEAILDLVRFRALSVAEIAADLDLPLGVVRILLGDLFEADLIHVTRPVPPAQLPAEDILREVIRGLRAL